MTTKQKNAAIVSAWIGVYAAAIHTSYVYLRACWRGEI